MNPAFAALRIMFPKKKSSDNNDLKKANPGGLLVSFPKG